MHNEQTAREYALDQYQQGKISIDEANVLIVQIMGIKPVVNKLPMSVRKSLNDAVKRGDLGRVKKDGLAPEVYHHKNARGKALEYQRSIVKQKTEVLSKVFVHHKDL